MLRCVLRLILKLAFDITFSPLLYKVEAFAHLELARTSALSVLSIQTLQLTSIPGTHYSQLRTITGSGTQTRVRLRRSSHRGRLVLLGQPWRLTIRGDTVRYETSFPRTIHLFLLEGSSRKASILASETVPSASSTPLSLSPKSTYIRTSPPSEWQLKPLHKKNSAPSS